MSTAIPAPVVTCKCVKSKCLMLYCECYRQGITCTDDCYCIDCKNTKDHARPKKDLPPPRDQRRDARGEGNTDRAPAPPPRPSRRDKALDAAKLNRGSGCACKNSKCVKLYCVCFNAGVECNAGRCKCVGCRNPLGAVGAPPRAAVAPAPPPSPRTAKDTRCKCTKTHCLKLYCDCFRQDLLCDAGCDCMECRNSEDHAGPTGDRTRAKDEIERTRPGVFRTPKKRSGGGCSCLRNRCRTKYCDCNSRGVGCDPGVCTCINCGNMMKPLSEMLDGELEPVDEDETEVFAPDEIDARERGGARGLGDFSHLVDELGAARRPPDPAERAGAARVAREAAAAEARGVAAEESSARDALREEARRLEAGLAGRVREERGALEDLRRETDAVMRLEMEEPCRWNRAYGRLRGYVMRTGDLPPVPSACVAEADRRLSIWVQEMKSLVYSGSERVAGAPHRVEALEQLGVEWIQSSEGRWDGMHNRLAAHARQNGTARLPSFMQCRKSRDKDLIALRHWVDVQEQDVRSGDMARRRDRLKKLQDLGLPLKLTWEQEWDHYVVELLKFRSKYGHLNVSGDAHSDLVEFVSQITDRLKKGSDVKLTQDELHDLRTKGLMYDLEGMSRPLGRPPGGGGKQGDAMRLVPLERVKEVNYWAGMLEQLRAYQDEHGTLNFPPHRGQAAHRGRGDVHGHLRGWVEAQRKSFENRTLEESRIDELRNLGLEFNPWNTMFQKLRKYKREGGTCRLPKTYESNEEGMEEDEDVAELCKWTQDQIRLYRRDELDSEKKKQLRKLGVYLTKGHMGKIPWEDRFEEMMEYYHTNKTCLPKRDGPLRQWVIELVNLIQNGYVSQRRQKLIYQERIGPYLRPEVIFKGPDAAGSKKRKAAAPGDEAPADEAPADAKRPRTEVTAV